MPMKILIALHGGFAAGAHRCCRGSRRRTRLRKACASAFADYKKGDEAAAAAKLREMIKIIDERGANRAGVPAARHRRASGKAETVRTATTPPPSAAGSATFPDLRQRRRIPSLSSIIKDSPLGRAASADSHQ